MSDSASGRSGPPPEHDAVPDPGLGTASAGVSSSLSELERKLRLLESELASVANRPTRASPAQDSVPHDHPEPAPGAQAWEAEAPEWEPGGAADGLAIADEHVLHDSASRTRADDSWPGGGESLAAPHVDLELLLRFRDQLERYSRALVTDYGRLLAHLGIEVPPIASRSVEIPSASASASPGRPGAAEATSAAPTSADIDAGPVPADEPNEYSGRGLVYEDILLEGDVALEVGPVRGSAALRELEHQLDALSGAQVRVRAFEGGRVVFDLRLPDSRRLVQELRGALSDEFLILDAAPGRLSIVLGAS